MADIPLSKETGKRAVAFGKFAQKLDMGPVVAIFNAETLHDTMIYVLANKDSMVIVYCTPLCYLVTHGKKNHLTASGADYLIIDKVNVFLRRLKKDGYLFLGGEELAQLQKALLSRRKLEKEPDDKDLKEIDDEEG